MKTLFWILVVVILVGVGILVYFASTKPRGLDLTQVGADSIAVYEQRTDQLEQKLETLQDMLGRVQVLDRPGVRQRIRYIESQLDELRGAIERWRQARDGQGVGQAYRDCIMLYGRAQAACEVLSYDTLPAVENEDSSSP